MSVSGYITSISADNPADMGGIVRIRAQTSPDTPKDVVLTASALGVDGSETVLSDIEPGKELEIGLHFILLPNGEQTIHLELSDAGGVCGSGQIAIQVANMGNLATQSAEMLREYKTPLFFLGPTDAAMYPYPAHVAWFDRPDAHQHIDEMSRKGLIAENEAEQLHFFVENGYLVFEKMIDDELVDKVNAEIDHAVANGYQNYQYGSSQRIELLQLHYENVRKIWLDRRHLRIVDLIFGVRARPCQTLTYLFGSQQDDHQDTIHLTAFPAGYMCGTWIALQDVVPDSGELVVYPGSHREKRVRMHEVGCPKVNGDWSEFGKTVCAEWTQMAQRYQRLVYRPKKGTVLVWHENLLHGGSVRKDPSLERRSIVLHSFADGAVVYYDSTGKTGSAIRREALDTVMA